jgi:hypothetical protein
MKKNIFCLLVLLNQINYSSSQFNNMNEESNEEKDYKKPFDLNSTYKNKEFENRFDFVFNNFKNRDEKINNRMEEIYKESHNRVEKSYLEILKKEINIYKMEKEDEHSVIIKINSPYVLDESEEENTKVKTKINKTLAKSVLMNLEEKTDGSMVFNLEKNLMQEEKNELYDEIEGLKPNKKRKKK